jgi:hypothetical protein
MRTTFVVMAAGALALFGVAPEGAQSSDPKSAAVLAQARKAIGGEQKLAAIKGLSIRGTYRRELSAPVGGGGGNVMITMSGPGPGGGGPPQLTGEIEIDMALPDKYIKVDIGTGMMAMTRTEGFEGDRPFVDVTSSQPGMRIVLDRPGDDPAQRQGALRRSREDLARLLLGLVAGTQPSFPVSYTYAAQAESPDGKADVIDVKGPDGFAVRLFLDAEGHLPLMLTYMAPEPRILMRTTGRGGATTTGAPQGNTGTVGRTPEGLSPEEKERLNRAMKEAEATPPTLVEHRLFFSDFREVGGLSLPHHITRESAGKTIEEWDVKSYQVNPSFKANRFKVGS